MIFFNWENLRIESKGNPLKLISILKDFKNNRILKYGLKQKLKGSSFLLNPDGILEDLNDVLYKYQYIQLAAKRDYSLYSLYGVKSLPLSHYPDLQIDRIRSNPLLKVTNTDIHFKYEE